MICRSPLAASVMVKAYGPTFGGNSKNWRIEFPQRVAECLNRGALALAAFRAARREVDGCGEGLGLKIEEEGKPHVRMLMKNVQKRVTQSAGWRHA